MNSKYLLNVSITPVQEFIKEARKIRDLWVGSYMLSMITFKALKPFITDKDCEIIYPDYENSLLYKKVCLTDTVSDEDLQIASLPNHFLVVVPEKKLTNLIASSKDNYYEKYWEGEIAKKVKDYIASEFDKADSSWAYLWDSQIKDHWQYMWVAIPVTDNELNSTYKTKAEEIQRFLEERKLTRTFAQWQGSSAIKCTQCGHREVVGPENVSDNAKFWKKVKGIDKFKGKFKKADRLCAVCTIKRIVQPDTLLKDLKAPGYESTSDISAFTFKDLLQKKLDETQKKNFIEKFNELAKKAGIKNVDVIGDIDGMFFYRDELTPKNLIKEYFPHLNKADKDDIDEIRKKELEIEKDVSAFKNELEEIEKRAKKEVEEKNEIKPFKPTKYYTIIAMDGDKIGEWLSGVSDVKQQKGKSENLGKIGMLMPNIIRNNWKGQCIYSGGDDLLTLGSLWKAISTSAILRDEFVKETQCGLSSGIVITHYSNPLRKAIELVRENVEKAKEEYGRDAFVITVQLSSGGLITAGYKWSVKIEGKGIKVIDILSNLATWMTFNKGLNTGFIYDIIKEIPVFYFSNINFNKDMFKSEVLRLIKRHSPRESPILKCDLETVVDTLSFIADPKNKQSDQTFDPEKNLINLLRIAAFFVREDIREI